MDFTLIVLIGLAAGISSGIFGIGGGVLIVPALAFLLNYPIHRAVGTSLAVLLPPIGAAAVFAYYRAGHVDLKAAAILAIMVFFGAWVGAHIANHCSPQAMRMLFGIFLLALGVYTLISGKA